MEKENIPELVDDLFDRSDRELFRIMHAIASVACEQTVVVEDELVRDQAVLLRHAA